MSLTAMLRGERRGDSRRPAAFSFEFRRPGDAIGHMGWMVNLSDRGALFVTAHHDLPDVGEELVLHSEGLSPPAYITDPLRPRLEPRGALRLPPTARVVRIEPDPGVAKRVAIEFDA